MKIRDINLSTTSFLGKDEKRPYREIDLIKTTLYGDFLNKDEEGKKKRDIKNKTQNPLFSTHSRGIGAIPPQK